MDINEVFDKIGGFGWAQMKIVYPVNMAHFVVACHVLLYSFVGEDPGWSCPQSGDEITSSDSCALVSDGTCTPKFSEDFTSIVTEVISS